MGSLPYLQELNLFIAHKEINLRGFGGVGHGRVGLRGFGAWGFRLAAYLYDLPKADDFFLPSRISPRRICTWEIGTGEFLKALLYLDCHNINFWGRGPPEGSRFNLQGSCSYLTLTISDTYTKYI